MTIKLNDKYKSVDLDDQSQGSIALMTIQLDRDWVQYPHLSNERAMVTVVRDTSPEAITPRVMITLNDEGEQTSVLLDPDEAIVLAKVLNVVARGQY